MKFLRFMFTGRMSFVLFVLLAFAFTVLYLASARRSQTHPVIQDPAAAQTR